MGGFGRPYLECRAIITVYNKEERFAGIGKEISGVDTIEDKKEEVKIIRTNWQNDRSGWQQSQLTNEDHDDAV